MSCGKAFELKQAQIDVYNIMVENGAKALFRLSDDSSISRDGLGNVKSRSGSILSFYTFPATYGATRKQQEAVGLKEETDLTIHTAVYQWEQRGYDIENLSDIDSIFADVTYRGARYEIVDKSLVDQLGDGYLYVVVGLNRV